MMASGYSRMHRTSPPSILEFSKTMLFRAILDIVSNYLLGKHSLDFYILTIPWILMGIIIFLIWAYTTWYSFCHSKPDFIILKEGIWINWDLKNLGQFKEKITNFYRKIKWDSVSKIDYKFRFEGPSGIVFHTTKGNFVKDLTDEEFRNFIKAMNDIGQGEKVKNLAQKRKNELNKLFKRYPPE
jgi:hypothetical protein